MSVLTVGDILVPLMEHPEARALVSGSAAENLQRVTGVLPASLSRAFGFEIRMDSDEEQTDLFMRIESHPELRNQLPRARSAQQAEPDRAWDAIGALCETWQREEAWWKNVEQLWLEFDVDGRHERLSVPAMCFWHGGSDNHRDEAGPAGLDPRPHVELARSATELLQGAPLSAEIGSSFERCLRALPAGGQVFCIGVMMARKSPRLRLCLKGLPKGSHAPYLRRIGLHDERQVPVIELATALADHVQLCFDVGETLGSKIHLELHFDEHGDPRGWRRLLGVLLDRGLVERRQARAFAEWLGPPWRVPIEEGGRPQAWHRRISHVKLSWSPDEGIRTKGYFGLWRSRRDIKAHTGSWTPQEKRAEAQRLRRSAAAAHGVGRPDVALERERAALELSEQVLGPRHPEVAMCLNGVGAMLQALGRTDEALAHYREALARLERSEHRVEPAIALINIGRAHLQRGEPAQALEPLERALDQLEREGSPAPWHAECCRALVLALQDVDPTDARWSVLAGRAIAALSEEDSPADPRGLP